MAESQGNQPQPEQPQPEPLAHEAVAPAAHMAPMPQSQPSNCVCKVYRNEPNYTSISSTFSLKGEFHEESGRICQCILEVVAPEGHTYKFSFQAHVSQNSVFINLKYLEGEPKDIAVWYSSFVQIEHDYGYVPVGRFTITHGPLHAQPNETVYYMPLQRGSDTNAQAQWNWTAFRYNSFVQQYNIHANR